MTQKIAVVLFNLGGPDSKESIEPFLMNFFLDKNIIRLPYPFRWMLAKLISKRRSKREAGDSYGELGDKSPLLANSQEQAIALENSLNASGQGELERCRPLLGSPTPPPQSEVPALQFWLRRHWSQ